MWFNGFNGKQRQLWAQVCCFYFEGEPILSGWTLGSLTELPHRGEEGNPCFYFSFQTARVELKNKLEPGGPSVNSCANVLVWCEGTEGLRLERPDLPYFSIVEKKKKKQKREGLCQERKNTTIWKLSYASVSAHFTHRAHHETLRCWISSPVLLLACQASFPLFVSVPQNSLWPCVVAKKNNFKAHAEPEEVSSETSWGPNRAARYLMVELELIPAPISRLETPAEGRGLRGSGTPTDPMAPGSGTRVEGRPAPGSVYQPAAGPGHAYSIRAWMARMVTRASCLLRPTGCWLGPCRPTCPLTCWEVRLRPSYHFRKHMTHAYW